MAKLRLMKRVSEVNKTFDDFYEEFILSRKIKNVRPATIKYYSKNLKAFKTYMELNELDYINTLEKDDINKFILWLSDKYENAVTINCYLRATRAFLYYAISLDYLKPMTIQLVKQDRKIKEGYTYEDIKKLIKKPNLKKCDFTQYRNWVLVQYFLETGNRLSTVINIKVKDVDLEVGMAVLRMTKNRRQMFSPLGKSLIKVLIEYIKEWGLTDEDYLFPNVERKQLTEHAIQKIIVRYNNSRGADKTKIHAFRHTFAKNYITKGGNAFKLQRLLGHSSLEITQLYVELFSGDLSKDFDQFSIIDEFNSSKKIKRKG